MNFKVSMTPNPRREMERLAKRMGDDAWQAVVRIAVGTAREMARVTYPRGASKKPIIRVIERDARRAVEAVPAKFFASLERATPGRRQVKFDMVRHKIRKDQLERGEEEINAWIEAARTGRGTVRRELPPPIKMVAPQPAFNRVLRRRRKLAGVTKGGWLGAGMEAARMQKGADRLSIGKNFMSWAQKWRRVGRATRTGNRVLLANRSVAAGHLNNPGQVQEALKWGYQKTRAWYSKAIRDLEK